MFSGTPAITLACLYLYNSFIYSGNKHTQKKLTNKQDKINKQTHE